VVRTYLRTERQLTLTGMYNALEHFRASGKEEIVGVSTLDDAHAQLDQAVAFAYGWEWPVGEDEALLKLLALNLSDEVHV